MLDNILKGTIHTYEDKFEKDIESLLLYRKIIRAEKTSEQKAEIELDNGIILDIEGNEGCGVCDNGWYYIDFVNVCGGVITKVETDEEYDNVNYGIGTFKIYVYAENKKINILSVSGYDNGYYGTGYSLTVRVRCE